MNYLDMKNMIQEMANDNYENFVKALISFEKDIDDKDILDKTYQMYMSDDTMGLLNNDLLNTALNLNVD